jgi:glycosyltransferase involved in cell wall biosynthesis
MRRMSRRVVIITEIIAPYRIPVFNALARHAEIDLHVIFLAENDPTQRQWLVYKDEIRFSYQVLSSWRRRIGKHCILMNWGMQNALRQAEPDFIVCGGYNYIASWHSMAWARRHAVPFFLWVESTSRDLRGHRPLIESLKTKFLRGCDGFIAAGKASGEYLRMYRVPQAQIFTAPNAVDTEFFARHAELVHASDAVHRKALDLPAHFFLYAGRLVREKGVFDLLDAYAALEPGLRDRVGLVFVGDGPDRPALQQRAATTGYGSIHFAGFAQRQQLATYYALADVLLFPTHTDPWGLVVNEAMASGLPVIASRAAGCVADLIEDGWNGRVVVEGKLEQLVSAMEELARNPELRSLMSRRCRQRISQYSPEAWAAGLASAVLSPGRQAA